MPDISSHIPIVNSINSFFEIYGLGKPLHPDIMCMRLEDQPDDKLMHMPLYRADFFRVVHFTDANLRFSVGDKAHSIVDHCLCFTYPGKLESWTRTGRLYGTVVYFAGFFAELDVTHPQFNQDYPYFNFDSELMIPLTVEESNELKKQVEEMIEEMSSRANDNLGMVRKLLPVYLHKIKRIYNKRINSFTPELKFSKSLYNRFRKALNDYVQELYSHKQNLPPTVSIIAEQLSVNANYLNSVIKEVSGKTASSHIQEKMMLEIKSFLIHTDLQISEIAYKTGFENIPYFNRFFKNNTGLPPSEFRKQFINTR